MDFTLFEAGLDAVSLLIDGIQPLFGSWRERERERDSSSERLTRVIEKLLAIGRDEWIMMTDILLREILKLFLAI